MKKIIQELEKKKAYYRGICERAENSLKNVPIEGNLRVANRKGKPQYYLISRKGDTRGKYISQNEMDIAKRLAQRDYDKKVVAVARGCCEKIERFMKDMPKESIDTLHLKSLGRSRLIKAYELSDKEYVEQWEKVLYEGKGFEEKTPEIYTNRGERVRSKSEKIIADKLFELRIPYRYEYPMNIKGYGKIYPDFTLLNISDRKEIILEHFGMMDNPEYAQKAISKIDLYERNEIFPGDGLLITYETSSISLNTRVLEKMLKRFVID